jgi:hypothetical protein
MDKVHSISMKVEKRKYIFHFFFQHLIHPFFWRKIIQMLQDGADKSVFHQTHFSASDLQASGISSI